MKKRDERDWLYITYFITLVILLGLIFSMAVVKYEREETSVPIIEYPDIQTATTIIPTTTIKDELVTTGIVIIVEE